MNNQLTTKLLPFLFLLFSAYTFSQEGTVVGTLNDDYGQPIPGVNVILKGTTTGTITDFDGYYSIKCHVGDVLVFTTIGMKAKQVVVTASMFGIELDNSIIEKTAVASIKSDAYKNALKNIQQTEISVPSIESSNRTYNKKNPFEYQRIKEIEVEKDQVKLTYFNPDIFYEVGYKTISSFQFVKNSNLPQLQTSFSQGSSLNGELAFLGAETGNVYAYGPELSALEFDGLNYEYDTNGRLVQIGNGSGNMAKAYNNSIFNTSLKTFNNVFLNITTNDALLGFDFTNKTQKDLYNIEKNHSNDLILKYRVANSTKGKLTWDTFVKYSTVKDNQPNINGFQNNLLLNHWITPPSFSNNQGSVLSNNTQRSFSPNAYNNPKWLFNNNKNSEENEFFVASIQNKFSLTDAINIESKLNYTTYNNTQNFGLVKNTIGFENGYLSQRSIGKNSFNTILNFNYNKYQNDSEIDIISTTNYTYEDLGYALNQETGFDTFSFNNEQNRSSINQSLNRNTLRLLNKFSHKWTELGITTSFGNNSYISSIQNTKWFLPTMQFKIDLNQLIYIYNFSNLSISINTAFDVNDASLLYGNQSHNSLNLMPSESLNYTAVNDLFLNNSIQLEEKKSYDINLSTAFRFIGAHFDFGFTYFNTKTKGAVFPVIEGQTFQLKNVADLKNKGFEVDLSTNIWFSNSFTYRPSLIFSTYRTKVTKLIDGSNIIPIAGFSTISKNLIAGQSAGVLVGSAFARDSNNNMIIDTNGFPLVASEPKIIGDPIPSFNIGFNNDITFKKFKMSFVIDFQKGGDVWNGTQNVLNYFGTSQQSANERGITNFVFNGVTEQENTNTTAVDFYNPANPITKNKFVRYGFEGVAEDAIEDGSYINLKSVDILYSIINDSKNKFIRNFDVGIYANNLITWSKFRGATPYSSLYGNASGQGLNFFNAPVISEIGLQLNIKI